MTKNKKIGLYFGTFNPIHVGHLIIANYMADFSDLDEVWLVISPQNPLKKKASLLADHHRLALARVAIDDNPKIKVSNIEFELPKPSFTINTLTYLKEKYPSYHFVLIMGEDNLRTFHKWKNHDVILNNHELYVYPRVLTEQERDELSSILQEENMLKEHYRVKLFDAPVMKVSASFIRRCIKENKDVRYLVTDPVYQYISEMNFYK